MNVLIYLAQDLDSIEVDRQDFKQENNLVDLAVDAEIGLAQRTKSDEEVFKIENQLALAKLLEAVLKTDLVMGCYLPNIGIENSGINQLDK